MASKKFTIRVHYKAADGRLDGEAVEDHTFKSRYGFQSTKLRLLSEFGRDGFTVTKLEIIDHAEGTTAVIDIEAQEKRIDAWVAAQIAAR